MADTGGSISACWACPLRCCALAGGRKNTTPQKPRLRTPLMAALKTGNLDELRQLLSSGADLNSPEPTMSLSPFPITPIPSYPLLWAVDVVDLEAVRLLLDSGADPNICCEYVHDDSFLLAEEACQLRLLCHATQRHPDIVTMLLDAGAEVNAQQRSTCGGIETALLRACRSTHSAAVGELLIERGADVNVVDEIGRTALFRAILYEHIELAARLIQAGADVDLCPPASRLTPLMVAFVKKSPNSLIQLLLQSGANPHLSDDVGRTALSWAAKERNVWAIKCLIAENVDLEISTVDPWERKHVFLFVF